MLLQVTFLHSWLYFSLFSSKFLKFFFLNKFYVKKFCTRNSIRLKVTFTWIPVEEARRIVLEDDPNEALSRFSDESEQEILDHHGSESNSEELVEEDSLQCRRLISAR